MKNQRKISFAISVLLIVITLASLFYIVKEENHYCTGDECPVCACIRQAEQTLRNLETGTAVNAAAHMLFKCTVMLLSVVYLFVGCVSLVSQKVRMND